MVTTGTLNVRFYKYYLGCLPLKLLLQTEVVFGKQSVCNILQYITDICVMLSLQETLCENLLYSVMIRKMKSILYKQLLGLRQLQLLLTVILFVSLTVSVTLV